MDTLLLEMLKCYGLKEIFGPQHHPEIVKMFHDIGYNWINDDETAWCSASLNFFCKKLGYERSGKLTARSWLDVGIPVEKPQLGDVVVYWRDSVNSELGHSGLYISEREPGYIYTLGGNQANMIGINLYAKSRVLGYRRLRLV
jgi:uncharacterized protein (TIGR02594 family)